MNNVLHLVRSLIEPLEVLAVPGVKLREFDQAQDTAAWLELRQKAFARERLGVRAWDEADFQAEFLAKDWWNPQRCWVAEAEAGEATELIHPAGGQLIGSVTMALRGKGQTARPVVHWLMVHPAWRRRGLGTALLRKVEIQAFAEGYRDIWLETHTAWKAAVRLYLALGFRNALNQAPDSDLE